MLKLKAAMMPLPWNSHMRGPNCEYSIAQSECSRRSHSSINPRPVKTILKAAPTLPPEKEPPDDCGKGPHLPRVPKAPNFDRPPQESPDRDPKPSTLDPKP